MAGYEGNKICGLILDKLTDLIVERLDPEFFLDNSLSEDLLKFTKCRDIRDQLTTSDKNRKIIESVRSKGDDGFHLFKKCLKQSGNDFIAEEMEKLENELQQPEQFGIQPVGDDQEEHPADQPVGDDQKERPAGRPLQLSDDEDKINLK